MLEDAVYYSRREQDEIAAAKTAKDSRIQQIHLLLADRYGQLARRALAAFPSSDRRSVALPSADESRTQTNSPRRLR